MNSLRFIGAFATSQVADVERAGLYFNHAKDIAPLALGYVAAIAVPLQFGKQD